MAESAAALVRGFAVHDSAVRVAGVIFNRVGGPRHRELLHQAMTEYGEVPVLGMVPRAAEIAIPARHLGLVMGGEEGGLDGAALERLVALIEEHVALERVLEIAGCGVPFGGVGSCFSSFSAGILPASPPHREPPYIKNTWRGRLC